MTEVTSKMVHAASNWLSNLHHMRYVDRLSAIEQAIRAALEAGPVPKTIAIIDSYVVPLNGIEYKVQRVHQIDGNYLWKAMYGSDCLSKSGDWEYEPLPSSRDDAFLARCRFATAVDAIDALITAVATQTKMEPQ